MRKMKLPNGYGGISKLSGNRRKPWRVRVTDGWEYNKEKDNMVQKFKIVGYYSTQKEAMMALAEYNNHPYDLTTKSMTFEEVYQVWSKQYFSTLKGDSSIRTITSAYSYCSGLYKMKIRDIRTYHLKDCMDKGYVIPTSGKDKGKKRFASANTQSRMKSLFNLMFDYAAEHEIVDKNYARLFNLDEKIVKQKEKDKKVKKSFTTEELELLWKNVDTIKFADMILIAVYSGWRPSELILLEIQDINFESDIMRGGLKTEAGKNRIVPIHPCIKDLIKKRYEEAQAMGSQRLFNDLEAQQGTVMTYDKYKGRFKKVMNRLGLESHTPHETRHTFITLCKDAAVDDNLIKLIVGHKNTDITENIYTHRVLSELEEAIKKVPQYRIHTEDYPIDW